MNSIVKNVLLVSAGAVVGFFTASVMARKEYQGVIEELEKELNADAMKKREERSKAIEDAKKEKGIDKNNRKATKDLDKDNRKDYRERVQVYHGSKEEPIATYTVEDENKNCRPPEDDNSAPYIISLEEFSEGHQEFDKVTVYYYVGDDTLVEEGDDIIDDITGTVGDEALDLFTVDEDGHGSGDMVYVRNEKLSIDYEIIGIFRSYKETVGIED